MRWSEADCLSRIMLSHAPRQATVSLILGVRRLMSRILLIASVAVFAFSLFLLTVRRGAGWPSSDQFTAAIFFWPFFLTAIAVTLIATFRLFTPDSRVSAIVCIALCLPLFLRYFYLRAEAAGNFNSGEWSNTAFVVGNALLEYHRLYPDRFHYSASDEATAVDGFAEWLQQRADTAVPTGWPVHLRFRRGHVLDPWGEPILYAADRNHDGYIDFFGRHSISGTEPPALNYKHAVAVGLGHNRNGGPSVNPKAE